MSKRTVLYLLAVSAVLALLLTGSVYRVVNNSKPVKASAPPPAPAEIVVARARIPLGTRLDASHLKVLPWSKADLPAGFSARIADVAGRVVLADLAENEPVLAVKLAPEDASAGLMGVIEAGYRAQSIKVNDVISVAGFATPGARVDVLCTAQKRDAHEPVTKTVLQNIPVLAAGQQIERDADGKPINTTVVTLKVLPDQGETLALASQEGKIQLALRNPLDTSSLRTAGVALSTLLQSAPVGHEHAVKPRVATTRSKPAPVPPPLVVEVLSGSKRTEQRF